MPHDDERRRRIIAGLVVEIMRGFAAAHYRGVGLARSSDLQLTAMAVFIGEAERRPLTLSGVARYTEMPPASVLRKLNSLIRMGYVVKKGRIYCLDQSVGGDKVRELTDRNERLIGIAHRLLSKMKNNRNDGNPT